MEESQELMFTLLGQFQGNGDNVQKKIELAEDLQTSRQPDILTLAHGKEEAEHSILVTATN